MANLLDEIFGGKPDVAPYTPTLLPEEQLKAIQSDISSFSEIDQLGSLFQDYMTSGFENAGIDINAILKGGSDMVKEMESVGSEFLKGNIPQDVIDQVTRSDAYTSLMSGGGGEFRGALTSRDLGLTSLNLINQGASLAGEAGNAAQRWAGLASGLIMSPSGMMITPQQQAAMTMQNRLYLQATQQFRNNVKAAPNPALQALNQWVEQVGGTATGMAISGGMGAKPSGSPSSSGSPSGNYMTHATDWGSPNLPPPGTGYSKDDGSGVLPPSVAASSGNIFDTSGDPASAYPMPYQSGIPSTNPFDTGGTDLWSQYDYNSNFKTGW